MDIPSCPFCPFSDTDAQFISEHIEFCHPENGMSDAEHGQTAMQLRETALEIQQPSTWDETEYQADKYVDCPHGCGEVVTNAELSTHLDLHFAEQVAHKDSAYQSGARAEELDAQRFNIFDDDNVQNKYASLAETGKARGSRSKDTYHKTPSVGSVKRLGVRLLSI